MNVQPSVGAEYVAAMVRGKRNPAHVGLPSRLKKARRHSGLRRLPLAEKGGASPSSVGDIETGKQIPTVGMIARLASALSVSAAWLAFGLGEMHTDGPPVTCEGMGPRLAAVRIDRQHSKASLARLADLTAPSIAQIENGGQAGVDTIDRLAKSLRVSPAWLAYGAGDRELAPRRRSRSVSSRATSEPSNASHPTVKSLD